MILKAPTLFLCCDQWEWTSVYNQLKTEPWGWVGTNRSPKEWCTTDDISTVLFWQDPPRISRRKVAAQRLLDFSLTNYHLTDGYPHVFSWPISFFNSYAVNRNNLSPYILSSELQCLLHGDSRNLCTNTRVQLLATHLLCHYKNSRTSSKILNHFLFWRSCTYFMSEKWRKKPQCWELK